MPKATFYAVRRGREGPKIYDNWEDCRKNTERVSGADHRSFSYYQDAVKYIKEGQAAGLTSRAIVKQEGSKEVFDLTGDDEDMLDLIPNSEFFPSQSFNMPGAYETPIDLTSSDDGEMTATTTNPSQTSSTSSTNDAHVPQADVIEILDEAPPSPPSPPIILSPEQQSVLDRVKEGDSVFFTGSAGTGKSVLLRAIINAKGGCPSDKLGITASTGIASVNIGGTTLHSWAGIGLGKEPARQLAGKLLFHKPLAQVLLRWKRTETLIIDEISMLDAELLEKLEEVARIIRDNMLPFGGIQLVLSGDFCQLPPVPDRDNKGVQKIARFAFEAECWYRCVGEPVFLNRVFRQKEQSFVDMLNEMRFGKVTPKTSDIFKGLSREVVYNDNIEPTELFALRAEVDRANRTRLNKLKGELHVYNSHDLPGADSKGMPISMAQMKTVLNRLVAQESVSLRVGAQVMLIKNLKQGQLVNGSVGKVVEFSTPQEAKKNHMEIATLDDRGEQGGQRPQRPLDPKVSMGFWPVVEFTNGQRLLCIPTEFTVENASGGLEARRDQIPLILAWALSIHKSQGQTLERVKVNLGSIFEKGQAYVALSRATRLETLQVLNFNPALVEAHPRVLEWMQVDVDKSHNTGNLGVSHTVTSDSSDSVETSDDDSDEMDGELARAAYYDSS